MIHSAVTVSLVPEARGGPFVFWDDLPAACQAAADLGFDAVELFAPSADAVDSSTLKKLLEDHKLKLAAAGTGAGWVIKRLHLVHEDAGVRKQAREFIRTIIDFAGPLGAPAIIGSMQGRWSEHVARDAAIEHLRDALEDLGEHAAQYGVRLIYEPLTRYETNLITTLAAGTELLDSLATVNVRLLADLFHMNIEEVNVAEAIRSAGSHVGHIHFVDSNRRPAGAGHTDFAPIMEALLETGYDGYLSAEALPYPDSRAAAQQTIESFRKCIG